MALGNTSVSGLMRSAESAATALESLKVQSADQQWQDSAKTADDYNTYVAAVKPVATKYANNSTVAGQSKAITYQNKLTSAKVGFDTSTRSQARINMMQGGGSQSDIVSLLAKQYGEAVDPNEKQSILSQYDSAVKTLDNQNTAAANKATSAAQSSLQKSYTARSVAGTTLTAQIAASIQTGKNQIDPKLLNGNTTVYINPDGTVALDQTKATPGSRPVAITIPHPGAPMNIVDLYHLSGMVMMGKYDIQDQASQDPGLTADEQAAHAESASSMTKGIQDSVETNVKLAQSEANQQPAIVRKYINGNASLIANPNVSADGEYILNPTAATIKNSLAAQQKSGSTNGVDFNMMVGGIPTVYTLRNLGNAAIANDPSATDTTSAKTFLFDANKGALVPLNQQHQDQFNQLRLINDPTEKANAEAQFMNTVQTGYQAGQAKLGQGATTSTGPILQSKIDSAGKSFNQDTLASHDPLGRLSLGASDAMAGLYARGDSAAIAAKQLAAAQVQAKANQIKDAATLAAHAPLTAPAPAPAAPLPKITAKPSQYNATPLPAPVPVAPGSSFKVPASTGNYVKDVNNLGQSLITPGYQL